MTTPASRLVGVAAVLTAMMPCEATSLQAVQSTATPTVLLVHGGIESGSPKAQSVFRAPCTCLPSDPSGTLPDHGKPTGRAASYSRLPSPWA